jgi:hypothetical protein
VISMAVTAAGWVVLVTRRLRRFQISTTSETPPVLEKSVINHNEKPEISISRKYDVSTMAIAKIKNLKD